MRSLKIEVKRLLLFIWRVVPLPDWAIRTTRFLISHKFIVGVLAVITDAEGRVLLFRHTYLARDPWGLPGGNAKCADLKTELRRELSEESGFSIIVDRLVAIGHNGRRKIDFVFTCSVLEGDGFKASEEVDDFGYFSLDELPLIGSYHRKILDTLAHEAGARPYLDPNFQGCVEIVE